MLARYMLSSFGWVAWPILNETLISPQLKKSTLDKDEFSNCRPIFNLSVVSKIIERVVKSRLIDHLTSSKLQRSPVCLL